MRAIALKPTSSSSAEIFLVRNECFQEAKHVQLTALAAIPVEDTAPPAVKIKEKPIVTAKEDANFCPISDNDVRKYQGRLHAYLRTLTKDVDQVLVLSQEVWLRVIKYKVILKQEADQFPTLARIARHAFFDSCRWNRSWVPLGPENEPIVSETNQNLDREELMQCLEKMISTFPRSEQRVFWFRYREDGLSWEEIAGALGISVHTAKKRYRRALERLRARIPNTLR